MTYFILILFILLALNEYHQFKFYRYMLDETHQAKVAMCYAELMNAYTHKMTKMISHWATEMKKTNTQYEAIMKHPFKSYIKQEIL